MKKSFLFLSLISFILITTGCISEKAPKEIVESNALSDKKSIKNDFLHSVILLSSTVDKNPKQKFVVINIPNNCTPQTVSEETEKVFKTKFDSWLLFEDKNASETIFFSYVPGYPLTPSTYIIANLEKRFSSVKLIDTYSKNEDHFCEITTILELLSHENIRYINYLHGCTNGVVTTSISYTVQITPECNKKEALEKIHTFLNNIEYLNETQLNIKCNKYSKMPYHISSPSKNPDLNHIKLGEHRQNETPSESAIRYTEQLYSDTNNYKSLSPEQSEEFNSITGKSCIISLPINAALPEGERIHLLFTQPEDFKILDEDVIVQLLKNGNDIDFYEFAPKTDTSNDLWSHIFTCRKIIGARIQADIYAQENIDIMQSIAQQSKLISFTTKNEGCFKTATFIMTYCDPNKGSRPEILWKKIYSGPYDTASIEYAIALTKDCDEKKALEIITEFINKNTQLIKF